MSTTDRRSQQDVILGHQLEVTGTGDQWEVAVDGRGIATRFGEAYDAWAAGVAESYRQGKVGTGPARED